MKKPTKTLMVLDYASGAVHFYNHEETAEVNDEVVSSLGFNLDECCWMDGKNIQMVTHSGTYTNFETVK